MRSIRVSTSQCIEQNLAFGLFARGVVERQPEEQRFCRILVSAGAEFNEVGNP